MSTLGLFPDVEAQNCRIEAFAPSNGGVTTVPAHSNSNGEMILLSRDLSGAVVDTELVSLDGKRTRYSDLKASEHISHFADDGSAIFSGPNGHRLTLSSRSEAVKIAPHHTISDYSTAAIVGLGDVDDSLEYHALIRRTPDFEMEFLRDLAHSSWAKAVNNLGETVVATYNEDWSAGPIVVRDRMGKVQEVPVPRAVSTSNIQAVTIGTDGTILAVMRPSDPTDTGTICVMAKRQRNGSYAAGTVPVPGRKKGDRCNVIGGPTIQGMGAFTFLKLQNGMVTRVPYVINTDGTVRPYTAICATDPRYFVTTFTGISDTGVLTGLAYEVSTWTEVAVRITPPETSLSSRR